MKRSIKLSALRTVSPALLFVSFPPSFFWSKSPKKSSNPYERWGLNVFPTKTTDEKDF